MNLKNTFFLAGKFLASLFFSTATSFAQDIPATTDVASIVDIPKRDSFIEVAELIDFRGMGNRKISYNVLDVIDDQGIAYTLTSPNSTRTTSIAVSNDSKYFAHGSNILTLWDVYTKTVVDEIKTHKNFISSMAFTRDNLYLVSGDKDGILCVTELESGTLIKKMFIHRGGITNIQMSNDGKTMITTGLDNMVRLWSTETWKPIRKIVAKSPVKMISLSSDGKYMAMCMNKGSFEMYNLQTSTVERSYGADTSGTQEFITSIRFFPTNDQYVVVTQKGNLIFWNVEGHKISHRIDFYDPNSLYQFIDICPDGKKYITAFFGTNIEKGYLRSWDAATNEISTNLSLVSNIPRFYVDGKISESMKNLFLVYQDVENETSDVVMYTIEMNHLLCDN